jgi:hypothetical protein
VNKKEVKLYLINLPQYHFGYSLLRLDKDYNIKDTLHIFTGENFEKIEKIEKIELDSKKEKNGSFIAFSLNLIDCINKKNMTLFKKMFDDD